MKNVLCYYQTVLRAYFRLCVHRITATNSGAQRNICSGDDWTQETKASGLPTVLLFWPQHLRHVFSRDSVGYIPFTEPCENR